MKLPSLEVQRPTCALLDSYTCIKRTKTMYSADSNIAIHLCHLAIYLKPSNCSVQLYFL